MGCCCGSHDYNTDDIVFYKLFPNEKNKNKKKNKNLKSPQELSKHIRGHYLHLDNYVFKTLSEIFDFILNNIEDEYQDEFSKKNVLGNSAADSQEKLEELEKLKEDQLAVVRLIIILAQTFYVGEEPNKKYLQEEIKGNKIFRDMTIWKKIIDYNIEENVKNSVRLDKSKPFEELKNEDAYITLIHYLVKMQRFNVTKDEAKGILDWATVKYKLSEETVAQLDDLIKDEKKAIDNIKIEIKN